MFIVNVLRCPSGPGSFMLHLKYFKTKKSRALSLPSYREDVAKDLLLNPQMLSTSGGKLPTNRRLMNNALNKLHYITSLLILIGLFFMPIFKIRKDD